MVFILLKLFVWLEFLGVSKQFRSFKNSLEVLKQFRSFENSLGIQAHFLNQFRMVLISNSSKLMSFERQLYSILKPWLIRLVDQLIIIKKKFFTINFQKITDNY